MTTSEAIDIFKEYLTTKIVPRPIELVEASKIAIKVLTQQLEEMDKQYHWKPSEEQMEALDEYIYAKDPNTEKYSKAVLSLRDELKELM